MTTEKQRHCSHNRVKDIYEDHYACGPIYYGTECVECGYKLPEKKGWGEGLLDLGAYR